MSPEQAATLLRLHEDCVAGQSTADHEAFVAFVDSLTGRLVTDEEWGAAPDGSLLRTDTRTGAAEAVRSLLPAAQEEIENEEFESNTTIRKGASLPDGHGGTLVRLRPARPTHRHDVPGRWRRRKMNIWAGSIWRCGCGQHFIWREGIGPFAGPFGWQAATEFDLSGKLPKAPSGPGPGERTPPDPFFKSAGSA